MPDLARLSELDVYGLLWRILVTVLLLLILAGPGARMLRRLSRSPASPTAPVFLERR